MGVETSFFAAFLVGLLGGVHCLGMCGGIVGALTLNIEQPGASSPAGGLFLKQLAYNAGRILSYTLAGGIAGALGAAALNLANVHQAQLFLLLLAGLFMIALGLFLGGWWAGLLKVEKAGSFLVWRWIEPLGKRLIPVRSVGAALVLGAVWGWLPCGLVYSVVIWALASGSFWDGALLLLGFGLGTLPNLLVMGMFAEKARRWTRNPKVKKAAGALVILLGLLQISLAIGAMSGSFKLWG
ncbi:MAG: sulfite exporter TauE/SafE family protein [bacterium]